MRAMKRWYRGPSGARCVLFLAATVGATAVSRAAEVDDEWRFAVSPFTHHWRYSEEHKPVWAIGIERQRADDSLIGAAFFSNSFGQDSSYWYYGERYTGFWGRPEIFAQWSVGLLYGYRGKYEDKVPLNHKGFAPGALIGMGWNFNRDSSAQMHLLGDAGVMFQFNYAFR